MAFARTQRGIALLTAIMIVAIATAVAAKIAFAHQVWFRQMENVSDRGATDILRRAALHWASVALLDDAAQNSIDHLGEPWAQGLPILPVEGGAIKVSIEDAQGRFNLNNLVQNNQPSLGDIAIFQRLLVQLKLDPLLANALVDWIDADSNVTSPGGAEDVDYLILKTPYRAANQPLASVEELRLVKGFDAKTVQALLPFVTVLPAGSRTAINVNTAPAEVLAALANRDLAWAQRLAENRSETPMKNVGEFTAKLQLPPGAPALQSGIADVKTDYFLITLETSIGRHQRRTVALMQRAGRATNWIWHRSVPLIDAPLASASQSLNADESTELR
jgi:general secretion pathway protein K